MSPPGVKRIGQTNLFILKCVTNFGFCAFEAQGLQAIWFCSVLLKMLRLLSAEATFSLLHPHQQLCYDKQEDEKGKNIKHTGESGAKDETVHKNCSAWFVFTEGSANLRVKEDRKEKGE